MKKSSLGLAAFDRVGVPDIRTEESVGKVKAHPVAVFSPRYRICQDNVVNIKACYKTQNFV